MRSSSGNTLSSGMDFTLWALNVTHPHADWKYESYEKHASRRMYNMTSGARIRVPETSLFRIK